jgi:hypothetical protein
LLKSSTPSATTKENASNKIVYMPLVGIGIKKANASNKVTNTPSTQEHLILVGAFQDYTNEIIGEDTSLDKDFDELVRIIKPLPFDVRGAFGNTRIKRKSFVVFNSMLNEIQWGNKMLVSSTKLMHTTSLEIDSNNIYKLKRSFKNSRLTISS